MAVKCTHCGSSRAVFRGYRYNSVSKKRLMKCKSCNRKFTPNDGFLRMRFPKTVIKRAVTLYKKGFSSSEVVLRLYREERIEVSRWTVLCWHKKYSKK